MRRFARTLLLLASALGAGMVGARLQGRELEPPSPEPYVAQRHAVVEGLAARSAEPIAPPVAQPDVEPSPPPPAAPGPTAAQRYEQILAANPPDPVWAADAEAQMRSALAMPTAAGSRLAGVRCGGDLCRMSIEHADDDGYDGLRLALATAGAFPSSRIHGQREGDDLTSLYITRPASN